MLLCPTTMAAWDPGLVVAVVQGMHYRIMKLITVMISALKSSSKIVIQMVFLNSHGQ